MSSKLLVSLMSVILLASCGNLPSTKVKTDEFINEGRAPSAIEEVDPTSVKIYKRQYPNGVIKDGDLLQVKEGYEDKIEILGVVDIELNKGMENSPFPVGPKKTIYVNDDDLSGLHKYCHAMNWQQGAFLLLMWIPNYLAPWNVPCYFQKDHSGKKDKDIEYRTKTLEDLARKEAAKLGGNAIIGYNVGGMSIINANSGATLANSDAWVASGFIVKFK